MIICVIDTISYVCSGVFLKHLFAEAQRIAPLRGI